VLAGAAVGIVVLALLAGYLVRLARDRPGDVVEAYLDAVRHKDATEALHAAGVKHKPSGEAAAFLTDKAMSGDWTVGTITVHDENEKTVEVDYTLEPTGNGTFQLVKDGHGWRISNPYSAITFVPGPVGYVEVGDVQQATDRVRPIFLLFPGVYHPYRARSALVTPSVDQLVVAPDWGRPTNSYQPAPLATATAVKEFQKAADAFFDECVAQAALPAEASQPEPTCTLTPYDNYYRVTAGPDIRAEDVTRASWHVVRRPTVDLPRRGETLRSDGRAVYRGQVTIPGVLRLDATGRDHAGVLTTFTLTCLVEDLDQEVRVTAPDRLAIAWKSPSGSSTPPSMVLQCS
jgi:hypothetical protein